ncbi:MAG TPA: hypothetical protein VI756_07955 [Blastocatellia bacterium]
MVDKTKVPTAAKEPESVSAAPAPSTTAVRPPANIFLNVHGTLLTLDNGRAFPRNSVMQLTAAEVERFRRAEAATRQRFIVPHSGPAHNA